MVQSLQPQLSSDLLWKKTSKSIRCPSGEFGVLYLGVDEHCAFIETLGQGTGIRVVTASALKKRGWAQVRISRKLALIDLVKSGGLRVSERMRASLPVITMSLSAGLKLSGNIL